jgi:hypothetical protein
MKMLAACSIAVSDYTLETKSAVTTINCYTLGEAAAKLRISTKTLRGVLTVEKICCEARRHNIPVHDEHDVFHSQ